MIQFCDLIHAPENVVSTIFKALEKREKLSTLLGYFAIYSTQCHVCFHVRRIYGEDREKDMEKIIKNRLSINSFNVIACLVAKASRIQ